MASAFSGSGKAIIIRPLIRTEARTIVQSGSVLFKEKESMVSIANEEPRARGEFCPAQAYHEACTLREGCFYWDPVGKFCAYSQRPGIEPPKESNDFNKN